jgi:SulP family sulfate permease
MALLGRRLVRRFRLPQLDMFVVLVLVSAAAWAAGWSDHAGAARPAVALIEAVPASLPGLHVPEIQ